MSHTHGENIRHGLMSEKPLQTLMDEIVPTSDPEGTSGEHSICAAKDTASLRHIEHGGGPRRHEGADGGVRIAGRESGEVVAVDADQYSTSEGSTFTLPPPYSSYFGEARYDTEN